MPICLAPLRIEYRFKPAEEVDGDLGELWVRVYPDDIFVDRFEETLTEAEARDLRRYWAGIWSAGGVEAAERTAWRGLSEPDRAPAAPLGARGLPADEPGRPAGAAGRGAVGHPVDRHARAAGRARTVGAARFLVGHVASGRRPGGADRGGRRRWPDRRGRAVRDAAPDYLPANLADGPPAGAARADTKVIVVFLVFPSDEDAGLRLQSWSSVPRARTLPDRLVLLGYNGGRGRAEGAGQPDPAEVAVSPDPTADAEDRQGRDGAKLRWSRTSTG